MIYGDDNDDHLLGEQGNDVLDGGSGSDSLQGGIGQDLLYGGADDDFLEGEGGNDVMLGGAGTDVMWGGEGNDIIISSAGYDASFGGTGNDLFILRSGDEFEAFDGGFGSTDVIQMDHHWAAEFPDLSWLHVTSGRFTYDGAGTITFSSDASGFIDLPDGTLCTFQNLEQIHLV